MCDDTNTHIHGEDSERNSADSICTQYDILIYVHSKYLTTLLYVSYEIGYIGGGLCAE